MSKTPLIIGIFFACITITSSRAYAQTSACFSQITIEPSFIAFTTKKESNLADWYQNTFGLSVAKEFAFPDASVTGVLMHRGEFIVEIFSRNDVFEPSDYVANAKPEQWRGVLKFGIYTDADLSTLKQCLNNQGIQAGRIFNDENLGINLLQIIDPEQNVLEIISRSNKL